MTAIQKEFLYLIERAKREGKTELVEQLKKDAELKGIELT